MRRAVAEGQISPGALAQYRSQQGQEVSGDDWGPDAEEDHLPGQKKKAGRVREDNRKAKGWLRRQD